MAISKLYAKNHFNMWEGVNLCEWDYFPGGFSNGAEWYIVEGGMVDFTYIHSNCFEIVIEAREVSLNCLCLLPFSFIDNWLLKIVRMSKTSVGQDFFQEI